MPPSIVCAIDASAHTQATLGIASTLADGLSLRLIVVDMSSARQRGCRVPAGRLCTMAREEQARFVVVGSGGDSALRAAIVGSVWTALVRAAPCPVVVVPPRVRSLEGDGVLCGVETQDDHMAAVTASSLAEAIGGPLIVSHVLVSNLVPAEPEAAALLSLATAKPRFEGDLRLRVGDPGNELLELAASARAALLVVGSRGYGPLLGGLLGSVSRELVRRATLPVVICRRAQPA